ncbi:unnamed protein product, partial [Ectocarpus sp. 12 AP-2014]
PFLQRRRVFLENTRRLSGTEDKHLPLHIDSIFRILCWQVDHQSVSSKPTNKMCCPLHAQPLFAPSITFLRKLLNSNMAERLHSFVREAIYRRTTLKEIQPENN